MMWGGSGSSEKRDKTAVLEARLAALKKATGRKQFTIDEVMS